MSRLPDQESDDDQHYAVRRDAEMKSDPQPVQSQPMQPRVPAVVRLAKLLQNPVVIGQDSGVNEHAGQCTSLVPAVAGPLVVLCDGERSVETDDDDQKRTREGCGA